MQVNDLDAKQSNFFSNNHYMQKKINDKRTFACNLTKLLCQAEKFDLLIFKIFTTVIILFLGYLWSKIKSRFSEELDCSVI